MSNIKYKLKEWILMKGEKEVFIPKDRIIDWYKELESNENIIGYTCGIEKVKP